MARRYSVLGQALVWIFEGPDRVRARAAVLLVAMGAALWATFGLGGAWFLSIVAVWIVTLFWHLTRQAQWEYYTRLARTWRGDTCPHCGYRIEGLKTGVCPECGVNATEYVARVRRHVDGSEPPD